MHADIFQGTGGVPDEDAVAAVATSVPKMAVLLLGHRFAAPSPLVEISRLARGGNPCRRLFIQPMA